MNTDYDIAIARPCDADDTPSDEQLTQWISAALASHTDKGEVSVRLVDSNEMTALNNQYRGKNQATTILSFPMEDHDDFPEEEQRLPLLGDIILCVPEVKKNAAAHQVALQDHWAHLVVHGTLHLLGHEHDEPEEAERMEQLETTILAMFNIACPYNHTEQ